MGSSRVYVGNLDPRLNERDLEDEFKRFGILRSVWVARKPPGFAFIDFEDQRDAEDSIKKLDGYKGWRVELSRRDDRGPRGRGGPPMGGGRMGGDQRCYNCGEMGHIARECRNERRERRDSPPRRDRSRSPPRRDRSPLRRDYSPRRSPPPRRDSPPRRGRSLSPRDRSP